MKTYLVIGGSGLVGEHLVANLKNDNKTVSFTHHKTPVPGSVYLDIKQKEDVQIFITQQSPHVLFLPAALTNVDYCEQNPEHAYEINVTGVKNIVKAANSVRAKFVYFSTDYVFDGENGPYTETDTPNPINVYGRQKQEAEDYIQANSTDFLIIRTTVVYGWERQGKNFVIRFLNALRAGQQIQVPEDQVGTPTYAPFLAERTIELIEKAHTGMFHVAGPNLVSRYVFACAVAKIFRVDASLIKPVLTPSLNQIAKRPLSAGLTTHKLTSILNTPSPEYQNHLQTMYDSKKQ